jgi:hypothetical protein
MGAGMYFLPGLRLFYNEEADICEASFTKYANGVGKVVSRGDILRKQPPGQGKSWVPLYQGNGRFGSCFGPFGLHRPLSQKAYTIHGATQFTHMKHHVRGKFNADYLLPVGYIHWETEPEMVLAYEQHQSFYDGTISTFFKTNDYSVRIVTCFDAVERDVAIFRIEVKGNCPAIIVSSPRSIASMYNQQLQSEVQGTLQMNEWKASIKCLNVETELRVATSAVMEQQSAALKITLKPGLNDIVISVNNKKNAKASESLKQTKVWWNKTWQQSGWLDLPDDHAQRIWIRSMAYTLYSHNDDGLGCSPPTGLAGNAWPFPFPFDSGCRHPLLLWTGQINAAKLWIEYWHSRLEGLKAYTRRLYKSDGVFMPHVFPYGEADNYHQPEVPNYYYYPVYNSALMARMCDETAVMVNDARWTKTYAAPLIREAAIFYLSNLKRGEDGLWHLHLIPSISLDESGKTDKPDYFAALVSAQYSLQKAIEYGLDPDGKMKSVLNDGLAFKNLVAQNGMYRNHVGYELEDFGKQKHADQLFPLVHLPLGAVPDSATRKAGELRYDITAGAKTNRFIGHTLGEFILASARMHNKDYWFKDWSMIEPSSYMDPEKIQFYESTGNNLAFYITTHGLFAQALLETIVSTWWKELHLAACFPWKGLVRFGNMQTLLGVTVSGEIKDGHGKAMVEAWKDTKFIYRGREVTLKKGETVSFKV